MKTSDLQDLSNELLSKFVDYLNQHMGLDYPEKTWEEFKTKIPKISLSFGFIDTEEFIKWLIAQEINRELITTLAQHLTVGETYFFRDIQTLELLKQEVLAPLIKEREKTSKHIRIWSTACCTGEEPYTLAIILKEMIPNYDEWNISILGTDINTEFIKRAKKGSYRKWSFRTTSPSIIEKHFRIKGDDFIINKDIRKSVHFNYLNLTDENFPSFHNGTSNQDLILCNNVLIYFSKEQINPVIGQLGSALIQGGHLVVTAIEAPFVPHANFFERKGLGKNLFQKKLLFDPLLYSEEKIQLEEIEEKVESLINQPKVEKESKPLPPQVKAPSWERLSGFLSEGQYYTVIHELEEYFQNSDLPINTPLITLLIKAHSNLGHLDIAKNWCEKGLKQEQTTPSLFYLHAVLMQELNDYEGATTSLKKALFLAPKFIIAYFTLANIFLTQNRMDEGKKQLDNALKLLNEREDEAIVEHSEGMTVKRLTSIIKTIEEKISE